MDGMERVLNGCDGIGFVFRRFKDEWVFEDYTNLIYPFLESKDGGSSQNRLLSLLGY